MADEKLTAVIGGDATPLLNELDKLKKKTDAAMNTIADKVNVAGLSLKDLREAFGNSANSAAAMGAVIYRAFDFAQKAVKNYIAELNKAERMMASIPASVGRQMKQGHGENEEKRKALEGYLKELDALNKVDAKNESQKNRELEILRKIKDAYGEIGLAVDKDTLKITNLADVTETTLKKHKDARISELDAEYRNQMGSRAAMEKYLNGNLKLSKEEMLSARKELNRIDAEIGKNRKERERISGTDAAGEYRRAADAEQRDRAKADADRRAIEMNERIAAEEEAFVQEQTELREAQIEEEKKNLETLKQTQAREQELARASESVANAREKLAEIERRDAEERRDEMLRRKADAARERAARFGFAISDNYGEGVTARNRRVRTQRMDSDIATKMAMIDAGRRVTFTSAERRRISELASINGDEARYSDALERNQKRRLARSRRDAISGARSELEGALKEYDILKSGAGARDATTLAIARSNEKLEQLRIELQNIQKKAYIVR